MSMKEEQPVLFDPFQVLGISPEATDEQVRSAYFQKVREFPPERDPEGFKRIRKAFERVQSEEDRITAILGRYHASPAVEEITRTRPSKVLPPRTEDLQRVVLSLTDLERTSFKSDCVEIQPLLDALFEALPEEES